MINHPTPKCIKCGLRFRERTYREDETGVYKKLCWHCSLIWNSIGLFLESIGNMKKLNRKVAIYLRDVEITKTPTIREPF